jgi:hypothetical protein
MSILSAVDCGTIKLIPRAYTAWDISNSSALFSSPATWDLSNTIPNGTKAVIVFAILYYSGTSTSLGCEARIWDYDMGTTSTYALTQGINVRAPKIASTANSAAHGAYEGMIIIGDSRKLYYGQDGTASIAYRQYYILTGYII